MKTVNNKTGFRKKIGLTFVSATLLALSGCGAYSVTHIEPMLAQTPTPSRTNITQAIQCMGNGLAASTSSRAYIFLVRDLPDGTVKEGPYQNGALSDAGRVQFINTLSEQIHPHVGLVTDKYPTIFQQLTKEDDTGLNRFGLPSSKNVHAFTSIFRSIVDASRSTKQLPPADSIIPLVVDGSFTRMDGDNFYQEGDGHNAGSKSDTDEEKSGQIDFGKTNSARSLTLAVNLIDPRTNLVVSSRSFDLTFSRTNDKKRFRVALGDGFYGYSYSEVMVEGLHSAQQTLLDAAAMWVVDKAYGDEIDFSSCLTPQQRVTVGRK
ncbi:hypothetical protein [Thiothrix fructosivorans]|uniref:Curli production assembly/transport component CsgG n=1 Tax=Thiothrix fructosivorans TaxID=111770 RepID=A0A8B0SF03_9GAMM|nr:hypothetical protein [Thiothrix fructosivorans]MBO0614818.1 hypothetical protein [Thiothrix fructosivorans]QTX09634.1 hypothetical protein J1836_013510 [Thiothrix fructosivorans]